MKITAHGWETKIRNDAGELGKRNKETKRKKMH